MRWANLSTNAIGGTLLMFVFLSSANAVDIDPWRNLQMHMQAPDPVASAAKASDKDPWERLQTIFLPFSQQDEDAALTDNIAAKKVSSGLHGRLQPYRDCIREASRLFHIPEQVISAIIMVESGGQAGAQAATSTAKGLMQTIDATFSLARQHLAAQGVNIENDPYDPRASVMAGSWYLNRMFKLAHRDRGNSGERYDLESWRLPAEYYYAGPGHGRKKADVVIVYAGGRRIRVDKKAYSGKVLQWARVLSGRG